MAQIPRRVSHEEDVISSSGVEKSLGHWELEAPRKQGYRLLRH